MPKVIVKERRPESITVIKDGFCFVYSNSPLIFVKSDVSLVLATIKNDEYGFLEISNNKTKLFISRQDNEVVFVLELPKVNVFTVSFKELVIEINEALTGKPWLINVIEYIKDVYSSDNVYNNGNGETTLPPLP